MMSLIIVFRVWSRWGNDMKVTCSCAFILSPSFLKRDVILLRQWCQMQCLVTWNAHIYAIYACVVCVFLAKCKFRTQGVHVQRSWSAWSLEGCMINCLWCMIMRWCALSDSWSRSSLDAPDLYKACDFVFFGEDFICFYPLLWFLSVFLERILLFRHLLWIFLLFPSTWVTSMTL